MKRLQKKRLVSLFTAGILVFSLCGCRTDYKYDDSLYYHSSGAWTPDKSVLNGIPLKEDKSVYVPDEDKQVRCLYLTVQYGKDEELNKKYSWGFLKSYTNSDIAQGEKPYCDVIMKEGTEKSDSNILNFGYGETTANGKLTIKGNTEKIKSRSFQINLYNRAGQWDGVSVINLVKDNGDLSKMKQKLCFDAVEKLDNIAGMRTSFVRLFVRDTTGNGKVEYEDLGLYTYIEQPNKTYLSARGLDSDGTLYRAQNFDFGRHADVLMDTGAKGYSAASFESVLGIREADSHEELLAMLDKVNDESIPIDDTVKKYFNEENLLTFAAVNVLFSNISAFSEDYLLYSPKNSTTWYLIPDSFKNAFQNYDYNKAIPSSVLGANFFQNNKLLGRYLSKKENLEKLKAKLDEIRQTITSDWIKNQTLTYKKSILNYIYSVPEIRLLPRGAEYVEPYINSYPDMVSKNYTAFIDSMRNYPAPYITSYAKNGGKAEFRFTADASGGTTYYAEVSATSDFKTVIIKSASSTTGDITINGFPGAKCYVRIAAQKGSSVWYSPNIGTDRKGDRYYGCVVLEK